MVYRNSELNEPAKEIEPVRLKIPWYTRWFVKPFSSLIVLSDTDPICVQDAWGRKWYHREDSIWCSPWAPFSIDTVYITNKFSYAVWAHRASIGKPIRVK